jgi:hypothetical protein
MAKAKRETYKIIVEITFANPHFHFFPILYSQKNLFDSFNKYLTLQAQLKNNKVMLKPYD